jgi:hypothetical protein
MATSTVLRHLQDEYIQADAAGRKSRRAGQNQRADYFAELAGRWEQLGRAIAAGLFDQLDECAADEAEQDRQIAESYRADAQRCEVHVGLDDDALAELAVHANYPAVTA